MAYIAATSITFPSYYYRQEDLIEEYCSAPTTGPGEAGLIRMLFPGTRVKGRYFSIPLQAIGAISGFGGANDSWIENTLCLGEACLRSLFKQSDLTPQNISQVTFASSTGLAIPSIEARMINRLPFSHNLKRMPLYGLGCVAGATGLARVFDYLAGHPDEAVILLAAELCSLTFQITDYSVANIIACGLFGDAVGGAVVLGSNHPLAQPGYQPRIIDTRAIFIPDTERALGFDVVDSGLKIVLDPVIPELALKGLRPEVETFLAQHHLAIEDINIWLVHPGGPKVISGVGQGLGVAEEELQISFDTLEQVGNISSVSVLYMLDKVLASGKANPGDYALMIGMGPGFSAELVLLKW
ncbi:MAG TPA: 3-oxoacyl-[acyl-carrier-protein] synthase III C-terminal domain-containing protein [Chloroflexia bacterium]|nr:3-oxoacyl-[acyl-carrier-protein] synthase III C-terminal domain-containing protein [Chloroflexia bacterium]